MRRTRRGILPALALGLLALLGPGWRVEGATYCVAARGDDANPGTLASPFRTLAKGVRALKPGDTLVVRAGTYVGSSQLRDIPGGTSWDRLVTIMAHPGERPVIVAEPKNAVIYIAGTQYLVLDGLVIDGKGGADGIKITYYTGGRQAHHVRVRNTEVKNCPGQGLLVAGEGNELINLDVHDNGTNGFTHGVYLSADRNLIDGGKYYRNKGWGIHVYPKATNTTVRNVRSFDNGATGLGLVWGSDNRAYNNLVYRNGSGIHFSGDSPRCYNNTDYGNRDEGLSVANAENGPRGTRNADVRNNIVYGNGSGITDFARGAGTVLANNLTGDPKFVNAAAGDFRLRDGSPAIDRGADLRPQGVTADFEGHPRPRGKAFDVGADEFLPRKGAPARGPLRVHPANPRYFTDGGRAVYLTGSHTWAGLIDRGPGDPPPAFDFDGYLDLLQKHNHNFIRLWGRHVSWYTSYHGSDPLWARPLAWRRAGPGKALDGKPKFDLSRFEQAYFDRLRSRVKAASARGIYVSVMLFGGHQEVGPNWAGNPFHRDNNVNGIDGDPDRDGNGSETQTLATIPKAVAAQKAYVRKVIDTVNDLDNVLFEISNEGEKTSGDWRYDMIRFIRNCEKTKPKHHPVGMTAGYWPAEENRARLDASPAEWVSYLFEMKPPKGQEAFNVNDPFAADGRKVSLQDSDHWWVVPIYGNAKFGREWVWKGFCRGHNPILMEHLPPRSFVARDHPLTPDDPGYTASRQAMGDTRRFADRMDLAAMTPQGRLSSTKYCLAHPGKEYLVYQPRGGEFTVELAGGRYAVEWFDPARRVASRGEPAAGEGARRFDPPFRGSAVLYLKRVAN